MDIVRQKRRLDMGRFYMGYYQMIATSLILVKIFKITQWYWYLIIPILAIIICWIFGVFHEKYIYGKEQNQYYEQNPFMSDIKLKLKEILNEIQNSKR